jgi:hypothetical protein
MELISQMTPESYMMELTETASLSGSSNLEREMERPAIFPMRNLLEKGDPHDRK